MATRPQPNNLEAEAPTHRVKLMQREWRNTETFVVEAGSVKEARQKAQDWLDENKDLGDVEYKLEVEKIEEPEPATNEEEDTPNG